MIFCFFSVWLFTVSKAIDEKNPKRALVLNRYEIINVSKEKLTQININLRKEKETYPLLYYNSMDEENKIDWQRKSDLH